MKEIKGEEMVGGRGARCKSADLKGHRSPKDRESSDRMMREQRKSAFTIIELIIVMAIIAILTLLAVPKLLGYTQEARYTKLITTSKELERASERYFMDHEDWPRLTDDAYSAEEIHTFAEKIYDITGKEVILDPAGNYYDIDYDKLSQYVKVPDDKMHYVLRNPVGKVYALEGLTDIAKERATQIKPTDITFTVSNLSVTLGKSEKIELNYVPVDTTVRGVTFESANPDVATVDNEGNIIGVSVGTTQITVTNTDNTITKSITIEVTEPFITQDFLHTGAGQSFIVPESGRYALEAWGSKGGGYSGKGGLGGYSYAVFYLEKAESLFMYIGSHSLNGGGAPGRTTNALVGGNGGGATHIALNDGELYTLYNVRENILLVAGGGGGSDRSTYSGNYAGGAGGGANQPGLTGQKTAGTNARFARGGTLTGPGYRDEAGTNGKGDFGKGGNGYFGTGAGTYSAGGGGGSGYYGGAGGNEYAGGGGGSGYANTSLAIPGTIAGTTGLHSGYGKVKITYLGN